MIKNILNLFLILTILFSSNCFTQKNNQKDVNGKRTGVWKKKYTNGNLRYTGQFSRGKEVGTFKFYRNKKDVQIPEVIKVFSGSGVANVKYYTEKGKIKAEGKMQGKHRIGTWKYYFEDGKPMSIENYKNGKLDGVSKNFYPNGKKTTEINYLNGVKNGVSKTYSDEGILIEFVTFQNGKYNGKAEFYTYKGVLTEKGTFINGIRSDDDWTYYSADGSTSKKRKRKTTKIK